MDVQDRRGVPRRQPGRSIRDGPGDDEQRLAPLDARDERLARGRRRREGTRLLLFRQQVAYHHEATKFRTKTRREYPEVDRFLDGLDADARGQYDTVIAIDAELETWQANNRNVTFHYPTMVRARYENGTEEITNALAEAAELEGTITADDGAYPRFGFADEVAVNLVNLTDRDLVRKLSTARIALTELVYAAVKPPRIARPEHGSHRPLTRVHRRACG